MFWGGFEKRALKLSTLYSADSKAVSKAAPLVLKGFDKRFVGGLQGSEKTLSEKLMRQHKKFWTAAHQKEKHAAQWSAPITENSHAMDVEPGTFKRPPKELARALMRSAHQSKTRKAEPFRSSMSLLNFYSNRAGKNLTVADRERLNAAKDELRKMNKQAGLSEMFKFLFSGKIKKEKEGGIAGAPNDMAADYAFHPESIAGESALGGSGYYGF